MLPFSLVAALAAIGPATVAWWTGRALLARATDPLLPELLLARKQRVIQAAAVGLALILVFAGRDAPWAIPVLALGLLLAGFPLRRALFGETRSLGAYLWHSLRLGAGMIGFWVLLAATPAILVVAAPRHWPVAALMAVALVCWASWLPEIWLRLNEATPLERVDLRPRLDAIVERARIHPPAVYRYGARGAHVMNAFALPSLRRSSVAFGDTLLEMLDPDEIAAIFAHEVAHLEHHDAPRLRRLRAIGLALITLAVALPGIVLSLRPEQAIWVSSAYPMVVFISLIAQQRRGQANETESDLRGAVLCGDPQALARALIKLHAFARIPRRWPHDVERQATHPSLARRIQALQAIPAGENASGAAENEPTAPTVARGATPGAYIALDDARVHWFEGVPAGTPLGIPAIREVASSYRAVAYGDLSELRIMPRGTAPALKATDRTGGSWETPLERKDVAAVQIALDRIDVRLGRRRSDPAPRAARVLGALLLLVLIVGGEFGILLLPLLALLVRPGVAAAAALGVMTLGLVLVRLGDGTAAWGGPPEWAALAAMGLLGGWALWVARKSLHESPRRAGPALAIGTLVAGAAVLGAAAMATMSRMDSASLVSGEGAPVLATLALVLLGIAASLATLRPQVWRAGALAAASAGIGLVVIALGARRIFDGPAAFTWATARAVPVSSVEVPDDAYRLDLSPGGASFAVMGVTTANDWEEAPIWRVTVGSFSGARRSLDAVSVAFLSDDEVAALVSAGDSLELRLETVTGDGPARWALALPPVVAPELGLDRVTGRWTVAGFLRESHEMVVLSGEIGVSSFTAIHPRVPPGGGRPLFARADGSALVGAVSTPLTQRAALLPVWPILSVLSLAGTTWFESDLWLAGVGEPRRLGSISGLVSCGAPEAKREAYCAAQGRARAGIWRVGTGGDLAEVGWLPPGFDVAHVGLRGEVIARSRRDGSVLLLDAATGRGQRVVLPEIGIRSALDVRWAPGFTGMLTVHEDGRMLTLFRLD